MIKIIESFYLRLSKYKKILIPVFDIIFLIVSAILAFLLRFDFTIPNKYVYYVMVYSIASISIKIPVFYFMNVYHRMFRYTSLEDIINLTFSLFISNLIIFTGLIIFPVNVLIPKSIFFIELVLSLILLAGIRISMRITFNQIENGHNQKSKNDIKNLVIIGAGSAGEQIARDLKNKRSRYCVKAFLDDNTNKIGTKIYNIPVIARIDELDSLPISFDEILIAIPSANNREMHRIIEFCKTTGKSFKTVPSLQEIIGGKLDFKDIRDVSILDLLGREEIQLDTEKITDYIRNKKILVTGAGGSIGSELIRQCINYDPSEIVLVDNNEFNLFRIEQEIRTVEIIDFYPILSDVRNKRSMKKIFESHRPDIVLHAAAYKHVSMQEQFPWEAVNTNIMGTQNLLELSEEFTVNKFILVSTDKAVKPTSVMGVTKRVAELLVSAKSNYLDTEFMAVRFGNVLGSSGSVIPIFKEQIQKGGPVTVTHKDVKRYFMSIPEASQLILQSSSIGNGGEIFVLEMGKPVKIDTIAKDMIHLMGYVPNENIQIIYTGLRPGEKMFEELIFDHEEIKDTYHNKIKIIDANTNNNNLNSDIEKLYFLSREQKRIKIIKQLKKIVPDYNPKYLRNT